MAQWNENKHPREPRGSESGGQFTFTKEPTYQITSGFLSKHLRSERTDLRENNYGLGFISPSGYTAGAFKNSFDTLSVYAGKEFTQRVAGSDEANVSVGLVVGGVTGYKKKITPVLLPELIGSIGQNSVALSFAPKTSSAETNKLAIQLRRRF